VQPGESQRAALNELQDASRNAAVVSRRRTSIRCAWPVNRKAHERCPVEQPAKFDLVINLTSANALGMTLSFSLAWLVAAQPL
jgi:hypothetical protein